jgi:hypothetical protein
MAAAKNMRMKSEVYSEAKVGMTDDMVAEMDE